MHPEFATEVKKRRAFVKLITGRKPNRRRRSRGVHQLQPTGIVRAYFGALRTKVVLPARALVNARLVPELADLVATHARGDARQDAKPKKVNQIVKEISDDYFGDVSQDEMDELSRQYATATSDLQRDELARQLRAAVGVEVPIRDQRLGPAIDHFTATNVSLIRTIPERYFAQVEQVVLGGVGDGDRWEDIAEEVEGRFKVSEAVAKVIARDQVGKFFANLNEVRQRNLGITHFYWMTGADEKVCPICYPLNGKRFAWADPPEEGLPGEVHPQCGCSADPDTDELVEGLEEAPEPAEEGEFE